MPPRSRAAANPLDLDDARRRLADGRIVRVGISRSAQFPEGGTGRIRRIGDPEVDGDEYVQVEVTLNGTKDVLPFTPADLSPARRAPRSTGASPAADVRAADTPARARRPATAPARRPADRPRGPTIQRGSSAPADDDAGPRDAGRLAGEPIEPDPTVELPAPESLSTASRATAARRRPARAGSRRVPAVSISIATGDGDSPQWRLDVRIGSRATVRSATVSAAQVWRLVEALGQDAVTAAVTQVLDEQRQAATRRAEALAAELAAVRAELASLPGR